MTAISLVQDISRRFVAVIVTLLLFGLAAYLASSFIWLLPHGFRHARDAAPDAGTVGLVIDAISWSARSLGRTYPGSLMTPAFFVAGIGMIVAGLWRGLPALGSALIPWTFATLAIAGAGLYSTETTMAGLLRAWPFFLADAAIASLCWALARPFW
jgi:hypothetical protein